MRLFSFAVIAALVFLPAANAQTAEKPHGPPEESDWGKAVDGLSLRLRAEKKRWHANAAPLLRLGIRYRGTGRLKASVGGIRDGTFSQLEVDGVWYGANDDGLRLVESVAELRPELPAGACPLFYPLVVKDKAATIERLRAAGVQCVNFWSSWHPACDPAEFPDAMELRRSIIEIPCHQDLQPASIARLAETVRAALTGKRARSLRSRAA